MRVAIVGAGPVGLEAALRLAADGHDVAVYEAGEAGDAVRSWGHVKSFTPWCMNTTPRGRALLGDASLADTVVCPTGDELLSRYLEPLARKLPVLAHHRVVGLSRFPAAAGAAPVFRLLIDGPTGEMDVTADAVLDCTGVLGDPVPTGAGGLPALGERDLGPGRLLHAPTPVDHLGGKRVLVIGDGASACTALLALLALEPLPAITWLGRAQQGPAFASPQDDPLPERRALYDAATQARSEVRHVVGVWVDRYDEGPNGVTATLSSGEQVVIDHIVACCGFRPDRELGRALEATSGKAAATPASRYFVIGHKNPPYDGDFLMEHGFQQVDEVAAALA